MSYLGDMTLGSTITFKFTTVGTSGVPTQLAATTATTISVYPDSSLTQITAGATLTTDFDGITGLNSVSIALTGGNGYAVATNYCVVLATGTVGGTNVLGYVVGDFSVQNRNTILQPQAINSASFSAGAITSTTFTTAAIVGTTFITGAINSATFSAGAIVATTFASGAIVATTHAAGAITSTVLAAGAIHSTIFTTGAIVSTTFVAGAINSTVLASGAIQSTTFTTNAIVGTTLGISALTAISDNWLDRDMSAGTDSGSSTFRTARQALRFLRNRWLVSGGTLSIYKEDDTTTSWTAIPSTDPGAVPIVGNDPAGP